MVQSSPRNLKTGNAENRIEFDRVNLASKALCSNQVTYLVNKKHAQIGGQSNQRHSWPAANIREHQRRNKEDAPVNVSVYPAYLHNFGEFVDSDRIDKPDYRRAHERILPRSSELSPAGRSASATSLHRPSQLRRHQLPLPIAFP